MYHNFFIPSSVNRYLGCFHVLPIVNSAAMNNGIHVSFSILLSSGYMPQSGIVGSYGQYSCLETPTDGGAWLAAVHGVAKGQTRLSDFTFTFHSSLSCIGEGSGNPLQCSCLENPRDSRGWWAAVYGVAQSRTWLERLSSNSSSSSMMPLFLTF